MNRPKIVKPLIMPLGMNFRPRAMRTQMMVMGTRLGNISPAVSAIW